MRFLKTLVFALLAMAPAGAQAAAAEAGNNTGPAASSEDALPAATGKLDYQTDLFSGRFGYRVPIRVPPARNGSEPSLALRYSSSGDHGWVGQGWELELGHIQRETRQGVPIKWNAGLPLGEYDDGKGFVFTLNGAGSRLIHVATNEFRAEIESGFLRFHFLTNSGGNSWRVTDTSGNQFYFGETADSRMVNPKWGGTTNLPKGTFRWALNRSTTVTGTTNGFTYQIISGAQYPKFIHYNGHTGGIVASNQVEFLLETTNRVDTRFAFNSGYRVETGRRLSKIYCRVGSTVVRRYDLAYAYSPSTFRSLLSGVTMVGLNESGTLPATTFQYQAQVREFQSVTWTNIATRWTNVLNSVTTPDEWRFPMASGAGGVVVDLLDMDGDALPDRLMRVTDTNYPNFYLYQRNTGSGFAALETNRWTGLTVQLSPNGFVHPHEWNYVMGGRTRLVDLNGDSRPDHVLDPIEAFLNGQNWRYTNFVVDVNTGTGWSHSNLWAGVVAPFASTTPRTSDLMAIENAQYAKLIDLNGDGLPDRLLQHTDPQFAYTNWWVQFNTGSNFTGLNAWYPVSSQGAGTGAPDWWAIDNLPYSVLTDLNGDGLPDRVMAPKVGGGGTGIDTGNFNKFIVQFNNGYGFEPEFNWINVNFRSDFTGGSTTDWSSLEEPGFTALRDLNGDGLPDRVLGKYTSPFTTFFVQFNTGTAFATNLFQFSSINSQNSPNDRYLNWIEYGSTNRFVDLNADGLPDRVMVVLNGNHQTNWFIADLAKGPFPDLLTVVSNGVGGSVKVAYQPAATFPNRETSDPSSKGLLPFPMRVVTAVAAGDGLYPFRTNTFNYEGGFYDPARREFAGFHSVSTTDPLGTVQRSWFHQGGGRDGTSLGEFEDAGNFAKRGLRFRSELIGTNGQTYQVTLNQAEQHAYGSSGRYFAFTGQSLNLDYPGTGAGPRATAQSSAYDTTTGNLTNAVAWGEVTNVVASTYAFANVTTDDDVYQWTTYAQLSNASIINKPLRSWTTSDDEAKDVLAESLFTHDGSTGSLLVQRDRFCPDCYETNRFAYNAYGNLTITTNEAGIVTTTTFDAAQTFPAQQTTASFTSQFLHDNKSGALVWSKDATGLVSSNVLDGFFRLTGSWVSASSNAAPTVWLEKRSYTLNGISSGSSANFVKVERNDTLPANPGSGHDTYTFTDGLGRVIQVRSESETNNTFRVTQTVHDERGAVRVVTQPVFLTGTSYTVLGLANTAASVSEYDPLGRLKQTTSPMNVSFSSGLLSGTPATITESGSLIGPLQIAYQDNGNPWTIVVTDEVGAANGLTRKFGLDGFGRTNVIYDVFNGTPYATNRFVHDRLGRVTNLIDAAGNRIEYAYNNLGLLVALADPNLGFWQYERDYAGRVKVQTDGRGNTVAFDYTDPLGRLVAKTITPAGGGGGGGGYSVTYAYDAPDTGGFTVFPGQLAKVTDREGVERYSYDVRGRTLKVARTLTVNSTTYTSEFLHDQAGRQVSVAYPASGPIVTNRYDPGGNLTQVQRVDGGGSTLYFQSKGYAAPGELLGATLGNGTEIHYTYYPKTRRLQNLTSKKTSAGTNFQALAYTYNQVSDLTAITDSLYSGTNSASMSAIAYDNLHRLTSLTRPTGTTTYSYNALGNLLTNGEQGGSTYQYGTTGLLPHGVKQVGTNVYAYDLVGNLTHRAGQHLTYDPENRLASVAAGGLTLATFGYDDGGERLWKQGTNTLHVWIGSLYEARGATNLFHVFAGSRRIATFSPGTQLPGASGTTAFHYYHPDHLGSSSLVSDAGGAVAEHYEYTAYGRERANGAAAPDVSHRFTGQVFDAETGLYYYGARYYDAHLGRFIQADTIIPSLFDPQSWNRYAYALNNPLKYTDPTGHFVKAIGNWFRGFFEYSGPTYLGVNAPRATYGPPPESATSSPVTQASMRMRELGNDAWDTSGLQPVRNGIQIGAKINPLYLLHEGISGIDSTENNARMTTGEQGDSLVGAVAPIIAKGVAKGVRAGAAAVAGGKGDGVTYLYQKIGPKGEHLKFGITKDPATRYTRDELAGGRLKIIGQGERAEMLRLERQLHETLPLGPEERQLFYIQKQMEKGLKPPPYNK